jgi:hypothetical protein
LHLIRLREPRRGKAYKLARKAETVARWNSDMCDAECRRLTKRAEYQKAMRKLDAELQARNLFARASIGERAGMVSPPEWSAIGA